MIWFKPTLDDHVVCINGVCVKQKIEQVGESMNLSVTVRPDPEQERIREEALRKLEFEREKLRLQQEAFQRQHDIDTNLRNDVAVPPQEPPIRVRKGGLYYQVLMPNTKYKGASVLIQILPLFTSEELVDLVAAIKDDNDLVTADVPWEPGGPRLWRQRRDVLFKKAESKEEAIAMLKKAYPELMKKKEKTILTYNEDQLVDPIIR